MLCAAVLALTSGGCGDGDRDGDRPQVANPSVEEVKACLAEAGLKAQGGAAEPLPGDQDAPDVGELIVPPSGVFIAFYSSEGLADRLAEQISRNGEVTRHGRISVLYVDGAELPALSTDDREKIESCV